MHKKSLDLEFSGAIYLIILDTIFEMGESTRGLPLQCARDLPNEPANEVALDPLGTPEPDVLNDTVPSD